MSFVTLYGCYTEESVQKTTVDLTFFMFFIMRFKHVKEDIKLSN